MDVLCPLSTLMIMASHRVSRQLHYCADAPDRYKLCDNEICVPITHLCPCGVEEYQCLDGRCLHPALICDGNRNCVDGDDENKCKQFMGTPVGVIVGVSIAAVVITVVIIALALYFVKRRRRTSRQHETASEPLQSHTSSSDRSTEAEQMTSDSDGYRVLPKNEDINDDFALFSDALCTSTPRPDIRRQVHPGPTSQTGRRGPVKASMLMDIT